MKRMYVNKDENACWDQLNVFGLRRVLIFIFYLQPTDKKHWMEKINFSFLDTSFKISPNDF